MGLDLNRLLEIRLFQAFDVDESAFDAVIRDLADGTERTINLGDHRFEEAVISPDGKWLALTVASPVSAAAGHIVLVPNVRGSTGYGKRWYTADDKHRRLDAVADLAAEQIHAAMTARGRECELLVYGDEGHGLTKRANRADATSRAFAFLARHLCG